MAQKKDLVDPEIEELEEEPKEKNKITPIEKKTR
jgi:hypothetical protein